VIGRVSQRESEREREREREREPPTLTYTDMHDLAHQHFLKRKLTFHTRTNHADEKPSTQNPWVRSCSKP
jgi:hypothetical protein